ncbi:hypothetical protein [Kineococcus radiotolerans]|uniref:Uncharacterized protein n=1 Tax=Kineococcus radiotolerans (strain ATCC BAA-149 / DSM 14245 / SRS30216) TaxID=266940 RepID=A6W8U1_KINRD|nr:hypothetical protein [Kineococcus radiotolerans]ABS03230.1 hypothetical protein Krad_1744 [Kineococcus radiotolerans SRS30216 = ATCC BAA-149]
MTHIDKLRDAIQGAEQAWNDRTAALQETQRQLAREHDTSSAWERRALAAEAEVIAIRGGCGVLDHHARIPALTAEVERLHAAQQLPDVGPVTRDDGLPGGFWVDGVHFAEWPRREYLREGARYLAVAAFLDAEVADTSSDDEAAIEALADALAEPVHRGLSGCNVPPGMLKPVGVASQDPAEHPAQVEFVRRAIGYALRVYPDALRALDAHRARTSQEAGQ